MEYMNALLLALVGDVCANASYGLRFDAKEMCVHRVSLYFRKTFDGRNTVVGLQDSAAFAFENKMTAHAAKVSGIFPETFLHFPSLLPLGN